MTWLLVIALLVVIADIGRRSERRANPRPALPPQIPERPFVWTSSAEPPKLPPAPKEPLHEEGPFR